MKALSTKFIRRAAVLMSLYESVKTVGKDRWEEADQDSEGD